ncbi:MAG: MopE-related protein, partial [Patescibacteria group bacterium]
DQDGVKDSVDNCPGDKNGYTLPCDGSNDGLCCPYDDVRFCCPYYNPDMPDTDPGFDAMIAAVRDNCGHTRTGQADTDGDGIGNTCEDCPNDANHNDADNDGLCGQEDNCWMISNPEQLDSDNSCPEPPFYTSGADPQTYDPACGDVCDSTCRGLGDDDCQQVCEGNNNVWLNQGGQSNCCGDDPGEGAVGTIETGSQCFDGIDNNCDGRIDESVDPDSDGAGSCDRPVADCNNDPASRPVSGSDIYPGATEDCYNNIDDNCNGLLDAADPQCALVTFSLSEAITPTTDSYYIKFTKDDDPNFVGMVGAPQGVSYGLPNELVCFGTNTSGVVPAPYRACFDKSGQRPFSDFQGFILPVGNYTAEIYPIEPSSAVGDYSLTASQNVAVTDISHPSCVNNNYLNYGAADGGHCLPWSHTEFWADASDCALTVGGNHYTDPNYLQAWGVDGNVLTTPTREQQHCFNLAPTDKYYTFRLDSDHSVLNAPLPDFENTFVGAEYDWQGVAYGENTFVAISADKVMTSADGATWIARNGGGMQDWHSVAYGGGKFVAVANNGHAGLKRVTISDDGITWRYGMSTGDREDDYQSIAYGGGKFVAVASGTGNRVITSSDGIAWTAHATPNNNDWQSVAYGVVQSRGTFVAVANSGTGRIMTSTDGASWTALNIGDAYDWQSVAYGEGKFVAAGTDSAGKLVEAFSDGASWTVNVSANTGKVYALAYGGGTFVAVVDSAAGKQVITSPDGASWTPSPNHTLDNDWRSIAYGGGKFVAVASSGVGNRVMTSYNGIDWEPQAAAVSPNPVYWDPDVLIKFRFTVTH